MIKKKTKQLTVSKRLILIMVLFMWTAAVEASFLDEQ